MISNLLGDRNGRRIGQMRESTFEAVLDCSFFSMISNIFKSIFFPFYSALICLFCNDMQNKSECHISFQVSLFRQHPTSSRRSAFQIAYLLSRMFLELMPFLIDDHPLIAAYC